MFQNNIQLSRELEKSCSFLAGSFLKQGVLLFFWSLVFTFSSVLLLVYSFSVYQFLSGALLTIVVFMGAVITYYTVRINFDACLFLWFAKGDENFQQKSDQLDYALEILKLKKNSPNRSFESRIYGARKLFSMQIQICVCQFILFFFSILSLLLQNT